MAFFVKYIATTISLWQSLLNKAIAVSQQAKKDWEARPLEERIAVFIKAAELTAGKYRYDLMATTMLGQAKTIVQAEVDAACELADFYAFNADWGLVSGVLIDLCVFFTHI